MITEALTHTHSQTLLGPFTAPMFPSLKCQCGPLNQLPVREQAREGWEFKVVRQHECNFLLLASWLNYWAKRPPRLGAAKESEHWSAKESVQGRGGGWRDGEISGKERRDRGRRRSWGVSDHIFTLCKRLHVGIWNGVKAPALSLAVLEIVLWSQACSE